VSGKSRPNEPLEAYWLSGKADEAAIREPGDLPSSQSTRQTSVGVYRWMIRKAPQVFWSSLAPAHGDARTKRVSHLLKQAVDDASSDQRGKIPAIGCLPFAMTGLAISYLLNCWQKIDHIAVAPILEAP
jgi:hypothetical protein